MGVETYIKLYRSLSDHPIIKDHSAFAVFVWLLLKANYKNGAKYRGIQLNRGQVEASERYLSNALEMPKSTVRRSLLRLEESGMILRFVDQGKSIISIENYDVYQGDKDAPPTSSGPLVDHLRTTCGPLADHARTKKEEGKKGRREEVKKGRKEECSHFDGWWASYPRKVGKGAARKAYSKALANVDAEALLAAVREFARSDKASSQWCPYPATWLNQERWDDDRRQWEPIDGDDTDRQFKKVLSDILEESDDD